MECRRRALATIPPGTMSVIGRCCRLLSNCGWRATVFFTACLTLQPPYTAWIVETRCQTAARLRQSSRDPESITIRYDADTRCYFNLLTQKPTWVSLIYRTEPTTEKWKNRKSKKTGVLRSSGKQSGESVEPVLKKKRRLRCKELAEKANYPRESEGLCFYRRWFVCMSVCLSVCYHDN